MRYFGLAGWSGSGKTTLIKHLISLIVTRGFTISSIKRAHHDFDIDKPGKDSWVQRKAGASEVMVASHKRWALMHERREEEEEESLENLISRMAKVDLVLVEGFKGHAFDKLEIYRHALGKPLLAVHDPHIVAIACDSPIDGFLNLPVLDLNDPTKIADFILTHCALESDRR